MEYLILFLIIGLFIYIGSLKNQNDDYETTIKAESYEKDYICKRTENLESESDYLKLQLEKLQASNNIFATGKSYKEIITKIKAIDGILKKRLLEKQKKERNTLVSYTKTLNESQIKENIELLMTDKYTSQTYEILEITSELNDKVIKYFEYLITLLIKTHGGLLYNINKLIELNLKWKEPKVLGQ
jgi:hypothetical protein